MSKRAKWLVAVLALTGILAVTVGGAALAHGPADDNGTQSYCGDHELGGYHGHGAICSETVSELLGLTHEEIHELRLEDKSLGDIAADQGISEDALVAAIMAARTEAVQARVEAGYLTQEQADAMLEQMQQRTYEAINRTGVGPADWSQGHGCGGLGEGNWNGETGFGMGSGGMMHGGGGMGFGMGNGGMMGGNYR